MLWGTRRSRCRSRGDRWNEGEPLANMSDVWPSGSFYRMSVRRNGPICKAWVNGVSADTAKYGFTQRTALRRVACTVGAETLKGAPAYDSIDALTAAASGDDARSRIYFLGYSHEGKIRAGMIVQGGPVAAIHQRYSEEQKRAILDCSAVRNILEPVSSDTLGRTAPGAGS